MSAEDNPYDMDPEEIRTTSLPTEHEDEEEES